MFKIRGLSVFAEKNSKALKRRKYKDFCVFFVIWDNSNANKIWRK